MIGLRVKLKKYDKGTLFVAFILVFNHLIGYISYENRYFIVGNLHPLYCLAIICLFTLKVSGIKRICHIYILLIMYSAVQFFFSPDGFSAVGCAVNITKIVLCYTVMLVFKDIIGDVNYADIIKLATRFLLFLFIIATIWKTPYLWRLSDGVNRFENVRLKLLYNEPSEIGLHLGLIVAITYGLYLDRKISKGTLVCALSINLLIIYMAKPLLGIAAMVLTIMIDMLFYIFRNLTVKRTLCISLLLFLFALFIVNFVAFSDISIAERVRAILRGEDSSSRYRIGLSWYLLKEMFQKNYGIGFGFSRLTSSYYLSQYEHIGLTASGITASYFNILAEGGFTGIGLISYLVVNMVKSIKANFSYVKLAMLCFIVVYQLMGTYFTNPFCWMIYGLVVSVPKNDASIRKGDVV